MKIKNKNADRKTQNAYTIINQRVRRWYLVK